MPTQKLLSRPAPVRPGREIARRADEPVVLASVFKVPLPVPLFAAQRPPSGHNPKLQNREQAQADMSSPIGSGLISILDPPDLPVVCSVR